MSGPIRGFRDEYRWLSNFHPCKVRCHGLLYSNLEAAYQSCKTLDVHTWTEFTSLNGAQAKAAGKLVPLRDSWDSSKIDVMRLLLSSKFSDLNPELRQQLVGTGNREIIEDNYWGDTFWGVCRGVGANNLGKLLMELRTLLQQGETFASTPTTPS